jgi:hypothetical protein
LLFFLLVLLLNFLDPPLAMAQSGNVREYQIKAAFLFNFMQFVRWPDSAFAGSGGLLAIGVLGDDPFGPTLDETVQGQVIDGRQLTIIRSQQVADVKDCQVIFVCRSEAGHLADILSQIGSRPVLLVSEVPGFAEEGGDIDFYLSNGKVRFEVNPQSARQQGLQISSQLLALGKIVSHETN